MTVSMNPDVAAEMETPKIFQVSLRKGQSLILHDNGVAFAEVKFTTMDPEGRIIFTVFHDAGEMDIDTNNRFARKHPMEPFPSLR